MHAGVLGISRLRESLRTSTDNADAGSAFRSRNPSHFGSILFLERKLNANPKFIAATAQVDEAAVKPLPQ